MVISGAWGKRHRPISIMNRAIVSVQCLPQVAGARDVLRKGFQGFRPLNECWGVWGELLQYVQSDSIVISYCGGLCSGMDVDQDEGGWLNFLGRQNGPRDAARSTMSGVHSFSHVDGGTPSGVHIETHSITQLVPSETTFALQSDRTAKPVDLHCTVAIVLVKPGF